MEKADRTTLVLTVAIGGLLLGWLLSVAYAFSPYGRPDERPLLAWQDADTVARGRAVYAAQCAACHGAGGEGQAAPPEGAPASTPPAPPHDARGHTWQHPDFALFQLVKSGTSGAMCLTLAPAMPRFAAILSDREIADVLAFVKSRWPAALRERQDEVNAVYATHNATLRRQVKLGG